MKNEEHGLSRELSPEITGGAGTPAPPISDVTLMQDAWGALNFILAFYEPGQRYLDTNAWTQAEAGGRRAHAALRMRLDALVAEEQVAGSWSREANETDWKARCEAAEQALEPFANAHDEALERYPEAGSAYSTQEACSFLTWDHFKAAASALNPTPQGGKPDSEEG